MVTAEGVTYGASGTGAVAHATNRTADAKTGINRKGENRCIPNSLLMKFFVFVK
jgi:hypothetical protein